MGSQSCAKGIQKAIFYFGLIFQYAYKKLIHFFKGMPQKAIIL